MSENGFRLRILAADGTARSIDFERKSLTIGSGEDAAVRVPDTAVSELHLRLKLFENRILATDLNSETGTTLEGQPIAKDTVVQPGQFLQLGGTRLMVEANEPAVAVPRAAARPTRISTEGNAARVLVPEPVERPTPARKREPMPRLGRDPRLKELAARFLSDELPEALRPTEQSKRLQVALIWGRDQFIDLKELGTGQVLTVGDSPGASFVVHHPAFQGVVPLVQEEGSAFRLLIPAGAPAQVHARGQERSLDALVASGQARRLDVPRKGLSLLVGLEDRITLDLNELRIIARYTKPQVIQRRPVRERLDFQFISMFIILVLTAVAFERMVALTDFAGWNLVDDLALQKDHLQVYVVQPQPPPVHENELKPAAAPDKPNGPEGQFGKTEAPLEKAAPSKPGAPVVNTRTREADRQLVSRTGLLDALAHDTSDRLGPGGLGTGLNEALGGIDGTATMADAKGMGGMGARGGGWGGGGHALGIGGIGGPGGIGHDPNGSARFRIPVGEKPGTRIQPGKVVLEGGLTADEIGRVVKRHWNEIKYCYEKELNQDPNLAGKVGLHWEIGPVGDVTVSEVRESGLSNANAESCMVSAVRRWKFPIPRGGGVVDVNYPFIFQPQ